MTTSETPVLMDSAEAKKKSGLPDLTTLAGAHEQIANLEIAVEHRTVIGQATGILMERFQMDSDRAFSLLARLSQDKNIKVYAIATELVEHRQLEK
jgi:AmiR/NasT family two-component response regulator